MTAIARARWGDTTKAVILAGGRGTRFSEETHIRPKPLIQVAGRPLLRHIMEHYAAHGFTDFVVAAGYLGEQIEDYARGEHPESPNDPIPDDWNVEVVDTGLDVLTGGRVKRLAPLLQDGPFMLTYGDGLADVNIGELAAFHRSHQHLATVTAVHPPPRFGRLDVDPSDGRVEQFSEKPSNEAWINGGFFVLEPEVIDFIQGDDTSWEDEPLRMLTERGELMAFQHSSFWQCVDTARERDLLEELWRQRQRPFWQSPD